jgi:cell division protein FtsI/penicillin-binding protein 2
MTVPAWRLTLQSRVLTVTIALALWVAAIETRLVFLQVVAHADLVARAERQQKRTQEAVAKRGDILDRRGHLLATSVDADTIYAVPSEIADAADAVAKLCRAFNDCTRKERAALIEKLAQQRAFAYVRRQVSPELAGRVAALKLDGIGFLKESRRFYPNRELAAHLLGWVNIDNKGMAGIESTYDSKIGGKNGTILIQTDAKRRVFSRVERPPIAGPSIELTIDEYLQHIAERELHAGVAENRAAGGTAIIMNPHTGEILAMANEPTFNPNAYRDAEETERRNRAVQDLYEPGSTFKVVTASAALEEKVMSVNSWIDTSPGMIKLTGRKPITEDGHRNYGALTFTDVIVKSSNIGAIRIGFRIGTERLSRFVSSFGFGRPSSPDFPGESPGIVWAPEKWTESALASVSMGYQVGVTPLQMVTAVSSVANGGELVEPRVVRALYRGNRRLAVTPKILRRTINQETASTLTTIMEDVVARGTAKKAQIPGYTIAGKTGTASKLVNGHYSRSDYNASFVGFYPSRKPALAMIVVVDSPHGAAGYHGGAVAAPIFQRIAEAAVRYLGIPPDVNAAPPVLITRQPAGEAAPPLPVRIPAPAPAVEPAQVVTEENVVPDVTGLGAREAIRVLLKRGLRARLSGDGVVVAQVPAAGEPLEPGTTCRLTLDRFAPRRVAFPEAMQP